MFIRVFTVLCLVLTAGLAWPNEAPEGFNTPIPGFIMTPDSVETSLGELNFFDGIPDRDTRRTAKGRRPQYFQDPAVDHLHSMILSLVEELSVTRDRADALERLLEQSGVLNSTLLDQYQANDVAAAERQERRERFIARVFKTFADQAERETEDLAAPPFEEVVRIVDQ
jgi:hypothetical protein